jgi:hypothetical protein
MPARARTWLIVLAGVCAGWAVACTAVNEAHCGNHSGHATCRARSETLPHCDLCVASNDGCVAQAPSDAACRPPEDELSTSSSSATTTDASQGTSGISTDGGPDGTAGGGTAESTSTREDTSGDDGSTQTTAHTETGAHTGGDEPFCGNGKIDGEDEECDGNDFGDATCATVMDDPYGRGKLACSHLCKIVESDCCLGPGAPCSTLNDDCCGECGELILGECGGVPD